MRTDFNIKINVFWGFFLICSDHDDADKKPPSVLCQCAIGHIYCDITEFIFKAGRTTGVNSVFSSCSESLVFSLKLVD